MKEQNGTDLLWMDTQFSPDDSKLLEDNHKEMSKSIQQMRRLIEEEDERLQNKPELNLHFTSFCNNYQLLAERYEKLVGQMQQIGSLMPISFESDSCPDHGTPQQVMPSPKLGLHKSGNRTASPSSGGGSSDRSVKEGTDSSSVSSDSDSESGSFCSTNVYFKSPMGTDIAVTPKKDDLELAQERETDCASKVKGKRAYGALEQRLLKCEEELKLCNLKLQLSEEEAARLKSELENRDFQLEEGQVSELQQEILRLEAQIADSIFKNARLEELNASKDRMKDSDEEIARLKHELQLLNVVDFQAKLREAQEELDIVRAELATEKTQVLDLQDRITSYCNDLSDREEEIEKLKNESSALQKEFSEGTAKLKSDNVGLSNKQIELEARLVEWELRGKQLENQLRQCEDEKAGMRDARNDLETGMQVQINQLKQEVAERGHQIEALNNEHDKHKFNYDKHKFNYASKAKGKRAYGALEQRLLKCEEELKLCNLKLQLSEEEAARLKNELENRDFQLEGQVSELQQEILGLEAQIADSILKNARLEEELNASKDRMKDSDEEIARLKHELQLLNVVDFQAKLREAQEELDIVRAELATEKMQVLDLQDRIISYCNDLSDREEEIEKLKNESSALQKEFSEGTAKLKSDNVGLSNKQIELEARLTELELRGKQLEDQLRQCEDEKADMRDARNDLETGMQVQINQLKQEVAERGHQIEALNKEHDKHKFKYDTLMAEKDEITAKVNSLLAELRSKDIQIGQIEERLRQSDGKHLQLVSESESAQKVVQDLRSRVLKLETEVEVQRVMSMDRAEEKREAIRQLCFSLEHYRTGYEQLYQVLSKHKQHAIVAS